MTKRFAAILIALCATTSSAQAVTLQLNATSQSGFYSDFSIQFVDDGNGLLELSEISSFSGTTFTSGSGSTFFDQVNQVPTITGISTFTFDPVQVVSPLDGRWAFSGTNSLGLSAIAFPFVDTFSYSLQTVTPVPLPASALMLMGGLAGLAGIGRRKRLAG